MRTRLDWPWISLALAAAAVMIQPSPLLLQWLEYDRQAIADGEVWRMLTCHWTHWSGEHLVWDVVMFAVVTGLCERSSRRTTLITLGSSALAIPVVLWQFQPGLYAYRGLSGLDSAVFLLAIVQMMGRELSRRQWGRVVLLSGFVAAFALKVAYECCFSATVFVQTNDFTPVPLAHAAGAVVGLTIGLLSLAASCRWGQASDIARVALTH